MNHEKKKKKKNNEQQQFEFCEVCRLNHNQGRRHIYFPKHKSALSALLARFQSKLSEVKFFLKTPMLLHPEHAHQNRLWCVVCNCEILELDSPFACGNAIEHLASGEHWKRVKTFMWKYGGGMDRVDLFRISEEDFAKWEKKCLSMKTKPPKATSVGPVIGPSNDIHNELNSDYVNGFHENNVDSLNSSIKNGVVPLQSYTNEKAQVSCSAVPSVSEGVSSLHGVPWGTHAGDVLSLKNLTGCMDDHQSFNSLAGHLSNGSVHSGGRVANGESSSLGFSNLIRISHASQEAIEGNVHTGAPPPWLNAADGNQLDLMQKSNLSNLLVSRAGKSSKLNPKRVGAAWAERRKLELELEKRGEFVNNNFDANWLPNFGRVWQSGTRKESRKEFQMENETPLKCDNQSEGPLLLQPYISKRMRRDQSE